MSFLTGALYLISGVAVLCVGLELLIDRYLRHGDRCFGWSAIVLTDLRDRGYYHCNPFIPKKTA